MEPLKIFQFYLKSTNSYDIITVVANNKEEAKKKVLSKTSALGDETVRCILNGDCIEENIDNFIVISSDKTLGLLGMALK